MEICRSISVWCRRAIDAEGGSAPLDMGTGSAPRARRSLPFSVDVTSPASLLARPLTRQVEQTDQKRCVDPIGPQAPDRIAGRILDREPALESICSYVYPANMSEDRDIILPAARREDFPSVHAILCDTFESTWRPNITETAAQAFIQTDRPAGRARASLLGGRGGR